MLFFKENILSDKKTSENENVDTTTFSAGAEDIEIIEEDSKKMDSDSQNNEVDLLKADLKKAQDDYLYLRAEFDTFKRNSIRERSQLTKFGAKSLVKDLLGVLDNFDRALETENNEENFESFRQGIELTAKELSETLLRHGVTEVASQGVPFDPNNHEALSSEPTDQIEAGHVLRVFKKAYKLHDQLIRPAQVVVAAELDN